MEPLISEFAQKLGEAQGAGGWLAIVGVCLMFVVRFYSAPVVQRCIPDKLAWMRWNQWNPLVKFLAPFGFAFVGMLICSLATKMEISAAVAAAVGSGIAAMIAHAGTKAVADTVDARSADKPDRQPSRLRNLSGHVGILPRFDHGRVKVVAEKRNRPV